MTDVVELPMLPRQFAREYTVDFNGPKAMLRAGYPSTSGWQNILKDKRVDALIREELNQRGLRTRIDADEIIRELEHIAFANPMDLVEMIDDEDDAGNVVRRRPVIKDLSQLDRHLTAPISQLEFTPTGAVKMKMIDKKAALDLLGKHYGLFNADRSQVTDIVVSVRQFPEGEDE